MDILNAKKAFMAGFGAVAVMLGAAWGYSKYDAHKAIPVIAQVSETSSPFYDEKNSVDTYGSSPVETSAQATQASKNSIVNINTADKDELMSLDGIGEKTAENIIDYRNKNGIFTSIEDLTNVDGIGVKKYAVIEKNLSVGNVPQATTSSISETEQTTILETSQTSSTQASSIKITEIYSSVATEKQSFPIDINTANTVELQQLDGIGEVIAGRIVDYASNIGFNSVDDLLNVKGIGEKTLEKLRPYVAVNGKNASVDTNSSETSPTEISCINLNTATVEELKAIDGVGDVMAQRIVDYAQSTGFDSVDDLKNVEGIGEKRFEAIEPYVFVP